MSTGTASLVDLSRRLRAGAVADYLATLRRLFDEREGDIEAFLPEPDRFERLRDDAVRLEVRFPDPTDRPSLYGVPVGVKDIFHVAGFVTRAGCRLPEEVLQGEESAAVRALRHAGALILGKTVTTEFAYFAPGPTRNPHDLERTPGGSSSGSAAAVGAGLCPLALGTQTIGSIGRPASFCGAVGFKPSYGRISTAGLIPLAPSVDHVGFFTSDVGSAALAAATLCEEWNEVEAALTGDAAPGPVVGVPTGPYLDRADAEMSAAFATTLERLEAGGLSVYRVPMMPDFQNVVDRHRALVAAEAAAVHADWYARHPHLYRQKTIDLLEHGKVVTPGELDGALAGRLELAVRLDEAAAEYGIDVWASPAAIGVAPSGHCSTGDPIMNLPWTHAGVPAISLPMPRGNVAGRDNLPAGLQLAASRDDDERLLVWAARIEEIIRP